MARVGEHAHDVERLGRDCLSDDERAHLVLYRSGEAAERYVVTRSLVRAVLADHMGLAPRAIRVSRTDTGKPIVAEGVHFNVSHSGDLILLALCEERAVGVDVERRREVPRVQALTERWLSTAERVEVARLLDRGATESEAFLRIWSLKEARLKALGVGISGAARAPLEGVDVRPLDDLLDPIAGDRHGHGYVGAVAFA